MFKAARLARIKEVILDRGQVNVSTLSSLLNVSEVTIRSDLEQLEQENFVYRTHGGAILNEAYVQHVNETPLSANAVEYSQDKEYIASIAADMAQLNGWVFLGHGDTCYYIARALNKKNDAHVITNSLYAAAAFGQNSNAHVMLTGGNLVTPKLYLSGDMFLESIANVHLIQSFISVDGISIENGLTVNDSAVIPIIKKLREISDQLVVAADYTKFDRTSFMRIGDLSFADSIITNENIPARYKAYMFEKKIKLFTSYNISSSSVLGGGAK